MRRKVKSNKPKRDQFNKQEKRGKENKFYLVLAAFKFNFSNKTYNFMKTFC